jgi:hypothetical protein
MRIAPTLSVCVLLFAATISSATVYVYPSGTTFPPQAINTTGPVQYITLYNNGTANVTVNSVTSSLGVFTVTGTTPYTVPGNGWATYQVQFTPTAATIYNGKLTFTLSGAGNQTVNITGQGINTKAVPSLSTTSLTFNNQHLGANGPSQTLTITNKGTTAVKLNNVQITQPFTQTGYTATTTISPGKSFNLQIGYDPYVVGTQAGTLSLGYDIAVAQEVSLWGTSTDATGLGINSYPTLPGGVQGGLYQAYLSAAGGEPPYSWSVSGSLPSGLTLSNAGVISGTIGSSATLGNYSLTATVKDSSTPAQTATQNITVAVAKTTGANCNNTSFNASDGSGPLVPIMDLGTNSYLGAESGGLYQNGVNIDNPAHDAYGQGLAASIQPLDSNGNPDPNGKYVLLAVGLSVTQQLMNQIAPMANADPAKNSHLVVVDGGTGGGTANALITTPSFFEAIINNYLPNAGVTAKQVVAVWLLDVDGGMSGKFPSDMTTLQSQFETDSQLLLTNFPNLKIEYVSSLYYTGYSNGVKNLSNEPWTYESGFAVKNMIQDQLNGNANVNYDPTKGSVLAPWMAWGPYLWANGMIPRSDGLVWTCSDLQNDGTHPQGGAKLKGAQLLLNFLKQDDTAAPWFLAPGANPFASQPSK